MTTLRERRPRPERAPSRGHADSEAATAVSLIERAEQALAAAEQAETREAAMREILAARRLLVGTIPRVWSIASRDRDRSER